ncbi:hypothetical protein SDC9_206995 [bioreactor metagenome]|uniref:Uncharacterized protein n=1 Tax=bioreactor metagenome TaxID=1076179 RepID=A0A645JG00_9ZZZZ
MVNTNMPRPPSQLHTLFQISKLLGIVSKFKRVEPVVVKEAIDSKSESITDVVWSDAKYGNAPKTEAVIPHKATIR